MNIKSHGDWQRYTPSTLPDGAPANAMFARRTDGTDWYDYVNSGENFAEDTIKMTVTDGTVSAAVTDPTMLFPQNATVLEISDVQVQDPQKEFGMKLYDPAKKTFTAPPPIDPGPSIPDLLARIEALEKKKGP